ncbi:MAG TPA: FKBP-type peptidyl-prolyl cis-trans isomerase [Anaeromyxobacteraceae bacterium]|nr:FKBP-type peptidyl-prolyl cis-trans isomerase [Anaeromyxobacteraceae bacterium]
MAKAKRGDTVKLHYTGRLTDGTVFDSTEDAGARVWDGFRGKGVSFGPAQLVIGAGEMPPDFEEALVGLEPGEQVTVHIPAERAFGGRDESRVTVIPIDDFTPREPGLERFRVAEGRHRPNNFDPKVGDVWDVTAPDGSAFRARVIAKTKESITLDANHPLAGQDVVFDIRLVEVA